MKYLLDTCVLLWSLSGEQKKLEDFMSILLDERNYIAVSVVSYWEIAIKKSLGKLDIPDNLVSIVEETGFVWVNLETKHIDGLSKLPKLHTDPFDRLLIAQANVDEYKLLTADKEIKQYFSR